MKKTLGLLLVAVMLASLLSVLAVPASADAAAASKYTGATCVDTSWYDDNQSAKEFHIKSAGQLAGLATLVNDQYISFEGCTVYLDCDIVWNEGTFSADETGKAVYNGNPVSETNMPAAFTPIGTPGDTAAGNAPAISLTYGWFRGSFDGQGHVISGLYIDCPNTIWNGMFTVFAGPVLKNLSIVNSYISGHTRLGSFAGIYLGLAHKAEPATDDIAADMAAGNYYIAENLYSDAFITAYGEEKNARSGGIFGVTRVYDKGDEVGSPIRSNGGIAYFKNLWFNGSIYSGEAGRFCGGITANACGYCQKEEAGDLGLGIFDIVYENCLMTGSIYGKGTVHGGICSEVYMCDATFKNCLSAPKMMNVGAQSGVIAANGVYDVAGKKLARIFVENSFCVIPTNLTVPEDFVMGAFSPSATYKLFGADNAVVSDVFAATSLATVFNLSGPSIAGLPTALTTTVIVDSPKMKDDSDVTTPEETSFVFETDEETNPPATAATTPAPTTPAQTTASPADDVTTAAPKTEKSGCGGFTAFAAILVVAISAVAVTVIKKK